MDKLEELIREIVKQNFKQITNVVVENVLEEVCLVAIFIIKKKHPACSITSEELFEQVKSYIEKGSDNGS